MVLYANKKLRDVNQAVDIVCNILYVHDQLYPEYDTNNDVPDNLEVLANKFGSIIDLLRLSGNNLDYQDCAMIALLCNFYRGSVKAVESLLKSLQATATVTQNSTGIIINISSINTSSPADFISALTKFIKDYCWDLNGEPEVRVTNADISVVSSIIENLKISYSVKSYNKVTDQNYILK